MTGIVMRAEVEDSGIRNKLHSLIALGKNPADAMRDIATYGESTTRERFTLQLDPDGNRWQPSLRVQLHGGKTLTKDGHLGDSLSSRSGSDYAEWGVNRIYAAIHQLGGKIEKAAQSRMVRHRTDAKGNLLRSEQLNGKGLVFAKDSHKRVRVRWFEQAAHTIEMPKRAFLGVNDENAADIMDLLMARIEGTH